MGNLDSKVNKDNVPENKGTSHLSESTENPSTSAEHHEQTSKENKKNNCSAFLKFYLSLVSKDEYQCMSTEEVSKVAECQWQSMSSTEKEPFYQMENEGLDTCSFNSTTRVTKRKKSPKMKSLSLGTDKKTTIKTKSIEENKTREESESSEITPKRRKPKNNNRTLKTAKNTTRKTAKRMSNTMISRKNQIEKHNETPTISKARTSRQIFKSVARTNNPKSQQVKPEETPRIPSTRINTRKTFKSLARTPSPQKSIIIKPKTARRKTVKSVSPPKNEIVKPKTTRKTIKPVAKSVSPPKSEIVKPKTTRKNIKPVTKTVSPPKSEKSKTTRKTVKPVARKVSPPKKTFKSAARESPPKSQNVKQVIKNQVTPRTTKRTLKKGQSESLVIKPQEEKTKSDKEMNTNEKSENSKKRKYPLLCSILEHALDVRDEKEKEAKHEKQKYNLRKRKLK